VGAVQLHLAEQLVRKQPGVRIEHRGGTLVTGGFDGEDTHAEILGDAALRPRLTS